MAKRKKEAPVKDIQWSTAWSEPEPSGTEKKTFAAWASESNFRFLNSYPDDWETVVITKKQYWKLADKLTREVDYEKMDLAAPKNQEPKQKEEVVWQVDLPSK